jgi:hypothetical protein
LHRERVSPIIAIAPKRACRGGGLAQIEDSNNCGENVSSQDSVSNPFFDHPILNSPYTLPARHWELDAQGQPTQKVLEIRRRAEFITPIPKPKKRKNAAKQDEFVFDEGKGLSTQKQQYDPTSIINEVRNHLVSWRPLPNRRAV